MSLLKRLFGSTGPDPKMKLMPLYNQIVAKAREPHWYETGEVADSIDGRFDMIAAVLTLLLLRLEKDKAHAQDMAYLTELFIDDMDGQLREVGIGDMIVGKHIGKIMGALGGRLGAFREAFAEPELLDGVILRNIYRKDDAMPVGLAHVRGQFVTLNQILATQATGAIVDGTATW